MKKLILMCCLLLSVPLQAKQVSGSVDLKSYKEAKSASNQLKFTVKSTKVGLFSSDVDGYVKSFKYKAELSDTKLSNMTIDIDVKSMDTDNSSRDEKLHDKCMKKSEFPKLTINVPGPISINGKVQEVDGTVNILGKTKQIRLKLKPQSDDKSYWINGASTWSLKEMEIPDPSIMVAKLSDEIKIEIFIEHLKKEEN